MVPSSEPSAPARSVLEAAGDRSRAIAANAALLERFGAAAERFAAAGALEDAIAAVAVGAHCMALHHPGTLVAARLERVLAGIASRHLTPAPARERPTSPRRVLHVATETYGVGGHTRVLWRWVARDPGRVHDLVLTEQMGPIPQGVADAVQASGGRVLRLDPAAGRLARAQMLRELARDADVAVLYAHYRDPIPTLAFSCAGDRPPTVTFNHADHMLWLGASITDVLHCCRPCPANELRGFAPERVVVTPFPVSGPDGHTGFDAHDATEREAARAELTSRLGWPGDSVVALTVGHDHKYSGPRGATLLDMIGSLIEEIPQARLLAVGARDLGAFSELRERTHGRVAALGPVAGIGSLFAAADVYLESWPFGGQSATAEAASHALPVLSYAPDELEASLLATHPMYGANVASSPDEYRSTLRRLLTEPAARAELGARSHAAVAESDAGWEAGVERAYARAAELGPVPSGGHGTPPAGDPRIHTLTHVVQETIAPHHPGLDPERAAVSLELAARSPAVRELFGPLANRFFMPEPERRYGTAFAAPPADPDALRAVVDEFRRLARAGAAGEWLMALRPEDADAAVPVLEAAIAAGPDIDVDLQLDAEPRRLRPQWSLEVVAPGEPAGEPPAHSCAASEARERVPGRVSVVIVAHGQRAVSERCLELLSDALGDGVGGRFELVLVDNGSPDDTAELFERWSDRAVVVSLERNRNFAGGCNAGAAAASGELLVFLNNDVDVVPGALEALAATVLEDGAGAAGARLLYPDGDIQHAGVALLRSGGVPIPHHVFHRQAGDLPAARAVADVDVVTGACLAVRAELFATAGGFDEEYVNGWEDVDLCLRLRLAGERIVYRGDVELVHDEGRTRGSVDGTDHNSLVFYRRWLQVLDDDAEQLAAAFDAAQAPDAPPAERALPAAPVALAAPALAPSPGGDEARALAAALEAAGMAPALAEPCFSFVEPRLDAAERERLDRCRARAIDPAALHVEVVDGLRLAPRTAAVARLGAVPAAGLGDAAVVWASSPALVDALVAGGLHPERAALLPPPVADVERGRGGEGILAALPAHDRAATEELLAALAGFDEPLRLVPNVLPNWLAARVGALLPSARLLPACSSERRFAALAASADVVVACDRDEPHQRRALVAAAAGAAPVALAGGPAAGVLGGRLATVGAPDSDALRAAIATALERAGDRAAYAAAVDAECGPAATAARLRELVASARELRAPVTPARAEPSSAPRR